MKQFLFLALLAVACADPNKGDREAFKPTAEKLFEQFKWGDYRAAATFIVDSKRPAFIVARLKMQDDKNLSVADYSLDDVSYSDDGMKVTLVSRFSWMRLPSPNLHSDVITSEFVWSGGAWLLLSQDSGPFAQELRNP